MPYTSGKIKLSPGQDRRVKLTEVDKLRIKALKADEGLSNYKLAEMFGVSRRSIQFVLHPERLEANKQRFKERGGWQQYYDKEEHREAIKKTRRYKQRLYIEGELKDDKKKNSTSKRGSSPDR